MHNFCGMFRKTPQEYVKHAKNNNFYWCVFNINILQIISIDFFLIPN